MAKKRTEEQERLRKQSTNLALASGYVGGFRRAEGGRGARAAGPRVVGGKRSLSNLNTIKRFKTRNKAMLLAGAGLTVASIVRNLQSSNGVGDFLGQGVRSLGAGIAGGVGGRLSGPLTGTAVGIYGTTRAFGGIKAKRDKKALNLKKSKSLAKSTKPKRKGKVKFIRKNGRVIPIKVK